MVEGGTVELPVGPCAPCAREVLCFRDLDEGDQDRFRCVECAEPVDAAAVTWRDLQDLATLGYGAVLPEGGCGRPDCGQGRCGRSD